MAYSAIPPTPAASRTSGSVSTLSFDNTTATQSSFLGICADYMGFAYFSSVGLTAQQQADEVDRAYTSGIKMARTWFDPQGWAYTAYPAGSPNWSSASMTAFYTWLQAMKDRGINVILTMGWHFASGICQAEPVGSATPTPSDETVFCGMVSESLNQIINVRGYTNVVGCMFFTEPNNAPTGIPVGYGSAQEYYVHIVQAAVAKIVSDDASRTPIRPRISIIGPEEFSFTVDTWSEYIQANAPTMLDVYAAHSYCSTPGFAPLGLSASNCAAYSSWLSTFQNWVGDAAGVSKPFWADESGFLVGGDSDTTGYRQTADAGWQWARMLIGHLNAGAQATFIWMLQDQLWYVGGSELDYGIAKWSGTSNGVKPSWDCVSTMANLLGGGGGTRLYSFSSDASTLHGIGSFIPYGVRNAANTAGEWTFVVLNEAATTLTDQINLSTSIGGRTVYRYHYSAEYPSDGTATLKQWDQKYINVTTQIPINSIGGRSVTFYSTIDLGGSQNLSQFATTSSDFTGFGSPSFTSDGNWTNVQGVLNGWKKADNSARSITHAWTSAQTVGRVKLAFVGTTAGQVYATYTDTSTPSPVADYTLDYLSSSGVWTNLAAVSGNTSPNKTHSFTPVQTTAIRLTVSSAAATAQVNQMGVYAS